MFGSLPSYFGRAAYSPGTSGRYVSFPATPLSDFEGNTFPLCPGKLVGVIVVDSDDGVGLDTSPFSMRAPKDLTEESSEVFSEARKGFDMSKASVSGFLSLCRWGGFRS